ncbi:hypothetical protein OX283_000445 [Flavobacterium sp. SUN052]|uniref:hypothetical protein n=1 Tax=Flavobacterium sp. SUN052 TaxID=3002441 RepID=UPI00237E58E3|nr:hypothetical protein [Flavobacterium sp. SUN052]MEC4003111.1 hypothetical protein [Flavobacterium sp. SUN052]
MQGQVIVPPQKVNGKVSADSNDLEGIYIINLKTEKSTLTERGGYFSIYANVGDTLLFSAVQFKAIKVALTEKDCAKELFFVKMEPLIRVLDEVRINEYKNINAVSLGIISPNTKHYTPAERKLYTATGGGKNQYGLDTKISVDAILNAFSGRTAMLKKEVEVEKKETLMEKIASYYDENYFIKTLKIPEDYVKGFLFYIVEDVKFVEAVNAKNKTMATFVMNELAVKYIALIKEKK